MTKALNLKEVTSLNDQCGANKHRLDLKGGGEREREIRGNFLIPSEIISTNSPITLSLHESSLFDGKLNKLFDLNRLFQI